MDNRPKVFIASSTEGLEYAEAIFTHLEATTEPTLWTHELFAPTRTNMENLAQITLNADFGVVVFSPDDVRIMRGSRSTTPRDNVVFELGLLFGALGRDRVLVVGPADQDIGIPSDLTGINFLHYSSRSDNNYVAAVATACRRIVDVVFRQASRRTSELSVPFWNNVQERHWARLDLRSLIEESRRRIFVSGISLKYLVVFCNEQLASALKRGVAVEILIASLDTVKAGHYDLHKAHAHDEVTMAQLRWSEFADSLEDKHLEQLSVTTSSTIMTHSIGIYDDAMYVNAFCAGLESPNLPSFRLEPNMSAYTSYVHDALNHRSTGARLCGKRTETLLADLTVRGGVLQD